MALLAASSASALTCDVATPDCASGGVVTAWANCGSTTLDGASDLGARAAFVRDVPVHVAANFTSTTPTTYGEGILNLMTQWRTVWSSGGDLAPRPDGTGNFSILFPSGGLYLFVLDTQVTSTTSQAGGSFATTLNPSIRYGTGSVTTALTVAHIQVSAGQTWQAEHSYRWAALCTTTLACSWYVRQLLS